MTQETLQVTPNSGFIQPADGTCGASGTAAARRLARQAWLVRAAAVTFLAGGAFVSYLFFSTV
jgi:hypothetical protein